MAQYSQQDVKNVMIMTTLWVLDFLVENPGSDEDEVVNFIHSISDKIIHDVQGAKRTPIGQAIAHEIQRPAVVGGVWLCERFRMPCWQPFFRFDAPI